MNNEPVSGSSLKVKLPLERKDITVYEGSTITIPFSVKNNCNSLAWKSSSFLAYRIKELYDLGAEVFLINTGKLFVKIILTEKNHCVRRATG